MTMTSPGSPAGSHITVLSGPLIDHRSLTCSQRRLLAALENTVGLLLAQGELAHTSFRKSFWRTGVRLGLTTTATDEAAREIAACLRLTLTLKEGDAGSAARFYTGELT